MLELLTSIYLRIYRVSIYGLLVNIAFFVLITGRGDNKFFKVIKFIQIKKYIRTHWHDFNTPCKVSLYDNNIMRRVTMLKKLSFGFFVGELNQNRGGIL